jgi:peptidase E
MRSQTKKTRTRTRTKKPRTRTRTKKPRTRTKIKKGTKKNPNVKPRSKTPSVILASNCRTNKKLLKYINTVINKKFRADDVTKKVTISIILTAKLGFKHKSRSALWKEAIAKCKKYDYEEKLNAKLEFIDCSAKSNVDKFKKSIKKNDIILILGGDTFYLMYYLQKYKMDKLICNKIKNTNALLIGCCAGAIISGKSIHPTHIARSNKRSKRFNYNFQTKYFSKKENMRGLNLVKKNFLPHCTSKNKSFVLKKQRIYCLPEYKPYIQ